MVILCGVLIHAYIRYLANWKRGPDMWQTLFIISVVLIIIGSGSSSRSVRAGERDQIRSYYDRNGSFARSSSSHGKTTNFKGRNGRFDGTAIRNSDGTTSFYDKSGHFTGSSTNTTQPK